MSTQQSTETNSKKARPKRIRKQPKPAAKKGNNVLDSTKSRVGYRPRSILGEYSPNATVREDEIFIVLKSFFDKSGQEDAAYMTLGGVAGNDSLWAEVDSTWKHCLNAGDPKAAYMHMIEAVPLRGEFCEAKGWTDEKVFGLINQLLSYLSNLPKKHYCHITATVNMADYKKLVNEGYQMDSPADLCVTSCTLGLFDWYLHDYGGLDLEAHYYFDVGEPFEPILNAKWETELEVSESTGDYSFWSHIKHIGPAQMRCTPGIQVADMLAWATNRNLNELPVRYKDFIIPLRALISSKYVTWDKNMLRNKFRPMRYKPYGK